MILVALVALALLMPVVVHDLVRRPTIRRLGLRNVARRRGEAALVVCGSMLATALIVGSFIVGSSFDQSIRDIAATNLGPVDEIVLPDDPARVDDLAEAILAENSGEIDGVLAVRSAEVAVASVAADADGRRVEPNADLIEMDLSDAAAFGNDPNSTGYAGVGDVPEGAAVISRDLAEDLGAVEGDQIDLFIGSEALRLDVHALVESQGLAGFTDIVVAPGSVASALPGLGSDPAVLQGVAPSALLVSNTGGVFDGADRSDAVESLVEAQAALLRLDVSVTTIKADLLADAEAEGSSMTELFGTIGGFSVIAGVLLVVNLFVMLASERTVELGTMRAVGLKRGTILRAFALEGAIYGVVAAAVGALLGIAVGAGVMAFAATLFDGDGFSVSLAVRRGDLLAGAAIGLAISQLTVVLTSARMTKINIVRALKDLAPQTSTHRAWRRIVASLGGMAVGIGLFVAAPDQALAAMAGPVIAAVAAIGLLGLVIPRKAATVLGCAVALVWPVAVFSVRADVLDNPDVDVFLLQGVLLVGLSTALLASLDRVWLGAVSVLAPSGIAPRLGMAHPLARPVRSALLVAMYALVIFTVTFIAVLSSAFSASSGELARHVGGQYDLVVESNRTAPLSAAQLQSIDGVDTVSSIGRGTVGVGQDEIGWQVSSIDTTWHPDLAPDLDSMDAQFADSAEAWDAVVSGDGWVMMPADEGFEAGSAIQLHSAFGDVVDVRVAGLTRNGWLVDAGLYASADLADRLWDDERPEARFYVVAEDGRADTVATTIQGRWPEQGAEATTFLSSADEVLAEQNGFFTMLQGYLGLGLLIGIAGLGVVLTRAVRERRRELGMLAAIGVPARQAQRAFLVEASFIGIQGVVVGIGLGLVSAWQVITRTSSFEDGLGFEVPVFWLAGLALLSVAASVVAALAPAHRAGRVPPAVALRVTG